ncbi:MAG: hypothetical protein IJ639_07745, partial [Ruminococcus sp.]|nr:hypothetical protein [Ruminococcus sp.]
MKKIITVLLAAAIAATSAITLTACSSAGKTDATQAATQAATQTATQAAAQTATVAADTQSNDNGTGTSADDQSQDADEYAGITIYNAITHALAQSPDGTEIVDYTKGTYPTQGWDAWVLTARYPDGTEHTYYAGYAFCISADSEEEYSEEDNDSSNNAFDAQVATQTVIKYAEETYPVDQYELISTGAMSFYGSDMGMYGYRIVLKCTDLNGNVDYHG